MSNIKVDSSSLLDINMLVIQLGSTYRLPLPNAMIEFGEEIAVLGKKL